MGSYWSYGANTNQNQTNSTVIKVQDIARCPVTFGQNSVPVEWHILSGSCKPILSEERAEQLDIIQFNVKPNIYQPIMTIKKHLEDHKKSDIQLILKDFRENLSGLGKLKNHQVKLYVETCECTSKVDTLSP